jgi:hypothetical protein
MELDQAHALVGGIVRRLEAQRQREGVAPPPPPQACPCLLSLDASTPISPPDTPGMLAPSEFSPARCRKHAANRSESA